MVFEITTKKHFITRCYSTNLAKAKPYIDNLGFGIIFYLSDMNMAIGS